MTSESLDFIARLNAKGAIGEFSQNSIKKTHHTCTGMRRKCSPFRVTPALACGASVRVKIFLTLEKPCFFNREFTKDSQAAIMNRLWQTENGLLVSQY
jgi:hypothetical protein